MTEIKLKTETIVPSHNAVGYCASSEVKTAERIRTTDDQKAGDFAKEKLKFIKGMLRFVLLVRPLRKRISY